MAGSQQEIVSVCLYPGSNLDHNMSLRLAGKYGTRLEMSQTRSIASLHSDEIDGGPYIVAGDHIKTVFRAKLADFGEG